MLIPLRRLLFSLLATCCATAALASPATDKVLQNVRLPGGFELSVYADNVPAARSMALGAQGTLFVGTRGTTVYSISGTPGTGLKPTVRVLADKLNMPNGVAFRDGALYVAEVNRILRYDGIESSLANVPAPKVVRDDLPKDRHHGWKYIAFGPDGKLYVPIGAPCNVCNEPKYASITRMNADGSGYEVFARGIRNTVGFTWHPTSKELWFTDNGRDYLGDDSPPCELNVAPRAGLDFGFPYCHGKDTKDPEFGKLGDCSKMTPPVQTLGAHVAPLGVKFYTGSVFPEKYRNQVLIAEHGSWNRSQKNGYRITLVRLDTQNNGHKALSYEQFATGFNRGDEVFGRPVDLLVLEDGSMLISDDTAGAIYRLTYTAT
ncbi:PQQ-dependent sugar dehydrogenase [Steroidobacter sp.]|uniref:PQQ-dependent sugar dehydrogenase n=1 Tax=Steroidobacter sp. TaxID=1978227 RepID=UPI001A39F7D0|nr:sorbosone dehydrogenase family protein [Steroidobacter sp.]MBL8265575.1 sorbosone dehydrogenase family protein [Steroidobacter sp.]